MEAVGVSAVRIDSTLWLVLLCQQDVIYLVCVYIVLVFMSPDNALTLPWRDLFKKSPFKDKLCLVAIDEAHCIEEWYVY